MTDTWRFAGVHPYGRAAVRRLGCWPALLLVVACGGHARSAKEEIDANYRAMEQAFQRGETELIAARYTEDVEWYAPERPVMKGRSAIARSWKEDGAASGNRVHFDVANVEQTGDRADEVGRFTISAPDGGLLAAGTYLAVWARQSDGSWRARRGMVNWNVPPRRLASGDR